MRRRNIYWVNQTQVAKLLDDHSWIFSPFIRNILCRSRERMRCLKDFSRQFLVRKSQLHQEILKHMGLENFCVEPYFSSLRNNMRELVEVLAAVAAGVPQQHYGFYRLETLKFICLSAQTSPRACTWRSFDRVPSVNQGRVVSATAPLSWRYAPRSGSSLHDPGQATGLQDRCVWLFITHTTFFYILLHIAWQAS